MEYRFKGLKVKYRLKLDFIEENIFFGNEWDKRKHTDWGQMTTGAQGDLCVRGNRLTRWHRRYIRYTE